MVKIPHNITGKIRVIHSFSSSTCLLGHCKNIGKLCLCFCVNISVQFVNAAYCIVALL